MRLEFSDLNIFPLLQLIVTTEKLWGKKNDTERGLKNQRKYDNIEFIYIYIFRIYIYSFIFIYSELS